MPLFDLPLDELRGYTSEGLEPHNFEEFWKTTVAEASSLDLDVAFDPVVTGFSLIDTFDVRFAGFGGHPIRAWLRVPRQSSDGPVPVIVQYHGYNGGRGRAHDPVFWPLAGFAHLSVDTRGQGAGWQAGSTPDPAPGTNPEHAGFMTRGITSPETYYYRRVFTDAVRAVQAVRSFPGIDATRTVVTGGSQGGGIALAVAGLVPDLTAVMADVPFLSDFPRAITLTDRDPYGEVVRFLRVQRALHERVINTLSYIDVVAHARRATAPALFSVALMDMTCPPSTVFAAYNAYAGTQKDIRVYPFNDHEGGQTEHETAKLRWLQAILQPDADADRAVRATVSDAPSN
ncbi:acetylxylan esterase [Streptomyces sp. NPDC054919]